MRFVAPRGRDTPECHLSTVRAKRVSARPTSERATPASPSDLHVHPAINLISFSANNTKRSDASSEDNTIVGRVHSLRAAEMDLYEKHGRCRMLPRVFEFGTPC